MTCFGEEYDNADTGVRALEAAIYNPAFVAVEPEQRKQMRAALEEYLKQRTAAFWVFMHQKRVKVTPQKDLGPNMHGLRRLLSRQHYPYRMYYGQVRAAILVRRFRAWDFYRSGKRK